MNPDEARLLRLYMNANDRFEHKPLYEAVVNKARAMGLAGASVFRHELGFGAHRVVHDTMSEYSFASAPVVVEIVDASAQIDAILNELAAMVGEGLVTVSTVNPVHVTHDVHTPKPGE